MFTLICDNPLSARTCRCVTFYVQTNLNDNHNISLWLSELSEPGSLTLLALSLPVDLGFENQIVFVFLCDCKLGLRLCHILDRGPYKSFLSGWCT